MGEQVSMRSGRRVWPGVLAAVLLVVACRTPDPVGPDTDRDSDSDTVELACGPGTPPECVEKIDGTCFMPELFESWQPLTDELIADLVQRSSHCGFHAMMNCQEGRYISRLFLPDSIGRFADGTLDLAEGADTLQVHDGVTRELVAVGHFPTHMEDTACDLSWWGDAEAYACVQPMLELVQSRYYPSCTDDADAAGECDYCNCRYNDVTDVQNPACDVSAP